MQAALNHPAWSEPTLDPNCVSLEREVLVQTVNRLVPVLPENDLSILAQLTLPLAMDHKQINNYHYVINILCHIASCSRDPLRGSIDDALFSPGRPIDYMLGQVAPLFGKTFLPPDRLEKLPEQLAVNVRLQVQRPPMGEEPKPVPDSIFTINSRVGDLQIVTSLTGTVALQTLARHRAQVPRENFGILVDAILKMLRDRENPLANRSSLLHGLLEIADRITDESADDAVETIEPIAQGEFEEPSSFATAAENANPLESIKFNLGTPADLRGAALLTLAEFERTRPGRYQSRLESLLDHSLCDPHPEVRRSSFASARRLPRLSEAATFAVIMGTQDQDPSAAAAAFFALANKSEMELGSNEWHALIYSARMAYRSPVQKLRRNAAYALTRLSKNAKDGPIKARVSRILEDFGNDICYSIRQAALSPSRDAD
jgi:hypothetical protein